MRTLYYRLLVKLSNLKHKLGLEERCSKALRCPQCHERSFDSLAIREATILTGTAEYIECMTCDYKYAI